MRLLCLLAVLVLSAFAPARGAPDESAPGARFDVLEFRVEGNTVLSNLAIERAVYPFLGPERGIEAVEQARTALEKAYQKSGYLTVLVDIPEQKVDGGVVVLRVVEGGLSKVRVTGNRYYSAGRILVRVDELQEGQVPDFTRVQAQLGTLARAQDRKITPVLRPGPTPGTVEAELKVEDRLPLHGSVDLNNRQTPNTTPLRLSALIRYDNLWQREHSASFQVITAPQEPSSLQVFSISYVMPANTSGDSLAFYAVKSDSAVSVVGATNVIGKGTIAGGRYIIALPARGNYFHTVSFGMDFKDFQESLRVGTGTTETPISYALLSSVYRVSVAGPKRSNSGSIGLYTAPRGFFGNNEEEFARKRFGAMPNFIYLRADWQTEKALSARSAIYGRISGQLASQPLITNEQFAAGGADTVRGYLEVERLGDKGIVGSIELRRLVPVEAFAPWGRMTAIAFFDAAHLRILQPLPGQQADFELYSVGAGLRVNGVSRWNADVAVALPLVNGAYTLKGDPRALFQIGAYF